MSTYPAGTVAVATVDGEPNVRIALADPADPRVQWFAITGRNAGNWIGTEEITDVRPLVMLDLDEGDARMLPLLLRRLGDREQSESDSPGRLLVTTDALRKVADQIEAQTKPPRIPEPGLWGVVEATGATMPRRRWIHHEEDRWVCDTGVWRYWDDLVDPVLIRDGIEVES